MRARVLQKLDPDLAAGERTLLGSSQNAVVLEWGWSQAERDGDPHATEFRVYWQPLAPDVVNGSVTGPPTLAGNLFEMPATIDRPLAQDAMAGRYLSLPDYPFKIASHTAGQSIVLRLERSVLDRSARPPRRTSRSAPRSTAPSSARRRGPSARPSSRSRRPSFTATSSAIA